MIEVKNLSKHYGKIQAVNNISFKLEEGEILGFLGPNGAGKSTTMNMLTGLLAPSNGVVTIDGIDIYKNHKEAKKHLGYLPETPPLYTEMTVNEYIRFVCELKNISDIKEESTRIMNLLDIADMKHRLIQNLSKGYKQRVGLAGALVGSPSVLILDEPTVGLDPKQIIEMRTIIKNLKEHHTIILSSHILPEINALCDRVIIMNKGKIKAIDTPTNLAKSLSSKSVTTILVEGNKETIQAKLNTIPGITEVNLNHTLKRGLHEFIIASESKKDIRRDIFFAMAENETPIIEMNSNDLSLEDVFLKVTLEENTEYEEQKEEEPNNENMDNM